MQRRLKFRIVEYQGNFYPQFKTGWFWRAIPQNFPRTNWNGSGPLFFKIIRVHKWGWGDSYELFHIDPARRIVEDFRKVMETRMEIQSRKKVIHEV